MSQGTPHRYVLCACGSEKGWPSVSKCRACINNTQRLYDFTNEIDESIRSAWAGSPKRDQLSARISDIAARTGVSRASIKLRARKLQVARNTTRPWSEQDRRFLAAQAGVTSMSAIARALGRTVQSVACAMQRESISRRRTNGYAHFEAARVLGVSKNQIQAWTACRWIAVDTLNRITHPALEQFLREHLESVDLRRVDQDWMRETLAAMLQATALPDTDHGYDLAVNPNAFPQSRKAA